MIQRKTLSEWLKICLECINLKIAVSLYLSFEKEYLVKIFLSSYKKKSKKGKTVEKFFKSVEFQSQFQSSKCMFYEH